MYGCDHGPMHEGFPHSNGYTLHLEPCIQLALAQHVFQKLCRLGWGWGMYGCDHGPMHEGLPHSKAFTLHLELCLQIASARHVFQKFTASLQQQRSSLGCLSAGCGRPLCREHPECPTSCQAPRQSIESRDSWHHLQGEEDHRKESGQRHNQKQAKVVQMA